MEYTERISVWNSEEGSSQLRERLKKCLLKRKSGRHRRLAKALNEIRGQDWNACLFGGFPRDLAVFGPSVEPRDIDVVVENTTVDEITSRFSDHVERRTRFGGVVLSMYGWHVDIWPVEDTWAFQLDEGNERNLDNLPRTTFLNAEAIALQLRHPSKKTRQVYERGFFDGVRRGILEVNLAENPYPALCIVRALLLSVKLDFALGSSLVEYILSHRKHISTGLLNQVQSSHYGDIKRQASELQGWIDVIADHWSQSPEKPFDFSEVAGRQLAFWDNTERNVRKAYSGQQLHLWGNNHLT